MWFWLAMACALGPKAPPPEPAEPPAVEAAPEAPSPPPAPAAPEPPAEPAADCAAGPEVVHAYCEGTSVVGQWTAVDRMTVPDDAVELFMAAAPGSGGSRGRRLTVAVRGEELFLRFVTCGACRRVLGEAFEGRLDQLDEPQVLHVQETLGLKGEPAMGTAAAWTAFTKSAEGSRKLKDIVEGPLER